jgi:hypothetical protein
MKQYSVRAPCFALKPSGGKEKRSSGAFSQGEISQQITFAFIQFITADSHMNTFPIIKNPETRIKGFRTI